MSKVNNITDDLVTKKVCGICKKEFFGIGEFNDFDVIDLGYGNIFCHETCKYQLLNYENKLVVIAKQCNTITELKAFQTKTIFDSNMILNIDSLTTWVNNYVNHYRAYLQYK